METITWTVYYKKFGRFFWKKIENVTADGIISGTQTRYFMLNNDEVIEVPMQGIVFRFSSSRALAVAKDEKARKEQEAEEGAKQ